MEINPNSSLSKFNKASQKKKVTQSRPAATSGSASQGIGKAAGLSTLQEVLKSMPEERPERLAEGRLLKDDPKYPNRQQLRQIGELVVNNELRDEETEQ